MYLIGQLSRWLPVKNEKKQHVEYIYKNVYLTYMLFKKRVCACGIGHILK